MYTITKHIFLITLIFLFSLTSRGQWTQTNGPDGGPVSYLATSGQNVYAGTYGQGIFVSQNNGSIWNKSNSGLSSLDISSIAISGANVFVGTYSGGVFISANNGASWSPVNNGLPNQSIRAMTVMGSNIFVATDSSRIFRSTNNGSSWVNMNFGFSIYYINCFAVSGSKLFVGGGGGVFLSTDSGSTWSATGFAGSGAVTALVAEHTNLFAATAAYLWGPTICYMYRTPDNGISWTDVSAGITYYGTIPSIAVSDTTVFAGRANFNHPEFPGLGGIYTFNSANNNWTLVNNGILNRDVSSIAVNANNLFAGTSGGIYLSNNLGSNWATANSGLTNSLITDITINATGLFAGTDGAGVFSSLNSGITWSDINNGLYDPYIHTIIFAGSDAFVGTNNGVYRSSNNGGSWTRVDSLWTNSRVQALAVVGNNLFAATLPPWGPYSPAIYRSSDNGNSWVEVNSTISANKLVVSGQNIFAASFYGEIWLSSDTGDTWTSVSSGLPASSYINTLHVSGSDLFAGTDSGVFVSFNNGQSWASSNIGLGGSMVYDFVQNGSTLFAGTTGGVFLSTNNGGLWTNVSTGLTNPDVRSLAIDANNIYAGTQGSGVWMQPLSNFSAVETINREGLPFIYPNPARDLLVINVPLLNAKEVTIIITDIAGKIIPIAIGNKTIATAPDNYREQKIEVNTSDFAEGVYLVQIQTEKFIETKKVIIAR